MTKAQLLKQVYTAIDAVKDDEKKLLKIYEFLANKIILADSVEDDYPTDTEDVESSLFPIPEEYKDWVRRLADELQTGMNCYIHPETGEEVTIPFQIEEGMVPDEDGGLQHFRDQVDEWTDAIKLEPPRPSEAYKFRENFVREIIKDPKLQGELDEILHRPKPFRNFRRVIDDTPYLQDWYDFEAACLENFAYKQLHSQRPDTYPMPAEETADDWGGTIDW